MSYKCEQFIGNNMPLNINNIFGGDKRKPGGGQVTVGVCAHAHCRTYCFLVGQIERQRNARRAYESGRRADCSRI
jgi:hypothetical protein